ncbi:MAG: hypothetical protein JST04_10790 [Bdellovibrionales bacterium]|nr:hypothetical protein [Bdellovibrionales bacterium]
MRSPLSVLALATLFACAHAASRDPYRVPASQLTAEGCTVDAAKEVIAGRAKVPRYLYHFGKVSAMEPFVKGHGISEADFRSTFLAPDDRWILPPFRRGLYGSEAALRPDRFANAAEPSLIRIEIAEECRAPATTGTTLGILDDPRFRKWVAAKPEYADLKCYDPVHDRIVGRLYTKYETTEPSEQTRKCESMFNQFLVESGMRVVLDEGYPGSWYIRDPKCVKRIEGSGAETLAWMADPNFFGSDGCGPIGETKNTFRIFIRAAVSAPYRDYTPDPNYDRARVNWTNANLTSPPTSAWAGAFANAYYRCGLAGKFSELRSARANFDAVLADIDLYEFYVRDNGDPDPGFDGLCK